MAIDRCRAIGFELPVERFSWTAEDVIRYHQVVGAGAHHLTASEPRYVRGPRLSPLPTFGMTVPAALGVAAAAHYHREPPEIRFPGLRLCLDTMLHASQEIVVHRPLPPAGTASATTRVVDVWDKGSAAILVQEAELRDTNGALMTFRSRMFARGEGGFGGARGPSRPRRTPPRREPDVVLRTSTLPQQALLYQLCGERNPVHIEPERARAAGFPAPILQGVCVLGMVCKAVVDALLDASPSRVTSCSTNFTGVVYPGETLLTSVWWEDDGLSAWTSVAERPGAAPVLSDGRVTVH